MAQIKPISRSFANPTRGAGATCISGLIGIEVSDGTFKLPKSFDTADTLTRHIILLDEDEVITNTAAVKT